MGAPQEAHLSVQSDLSVLNRVQDWFRQFCLRNEDQLSWVMGQLYPLNLALAEGFTNAVRHAHRDLPSETTIELDIRLWDDRIEIRIWDQGDPFDPNHLEEPVPGTLRLGGYGWFLLRRLSDRVDYLRSPDGRNCLLIVKYRQTGARLPNRDEPIPQNRMHNSKLS
ncbi:MAG TPA: anti-sigma regulatory factor [Synechococcales cyanobacterium M55_K2018_004]|nr:anti-sigma regulatory factor [Synechococcales cyanobacterium M55_K2018_004]